MASRPNKGEGLTPLPTPQQASGFIAALLAPPCGFDPAPISDEKKRSAWSAIESAFHAAESHKENCRVLWVMHKTSAAKREFDEAWAILCRAADMLIRAPLPPGKRSAMASAHYWKRHALRRYVITAKGEDWKEIVAADKALIPPPQPRKVVRDA